MFGLFSDLFVGQDIQIRWPRVKIPMHLAANWEKDRIASRRQFFFSFFFLPNQKYLYLSSQCHETGLTLASTAFEKIWHQPPWNRQDRINSQLFVFRKSLRALWSYYFSKILTFARKYTNFFQFRQKKIIFDLATMAVKLMAAFRQIFIFVNAHLKQ